ncbi:Antitoxin RelJ [Corynebacterium capitovis DSM 44611]|uniref:type II toxin-antitoxin system Phd/YefM family antitoxin n=1 Tax=Corynebacterium capitovis TaxID=131081 RepID=UPI0003782D0B|nr:type II toxin-antitoxin system prevent-host-death family antitoxin [Corynebacterium capitovis]WKD56676.1 Antitoxin RelJ [Corynebacterium capitovis DSM 44611]
MSASEARRSLYLLIARVNQDREVVEIESRNGNAVLMAAEEYASLQETAHLLSSPANAHRLMASYERATAGIRESHELDLD